VGAEIKRHIVVFLATGQREEFRDVNAYAFVGPGDRDLELHATGTGITT
jgi:hypothetical protein